MLDFFSPVSPHDYVRQSMPYSYLTVSTSSAASGSPSVQIYSDIDNAWIGQFGTSAQNTYGWEAADRLTQVFSITPQGTAKFSEDRDMALWGSAVYCTRENASKLSRGVGIVDNVRESCVRNGTPGDLGTFKAGSVLAFSHDLGSLEGTENVTFVIGHVRDEAVDYLGKDRSGYFRSECKDFNCGCMHALDDFHSADKESRGLDAFIAASDVGSANYSNILALSTRQAFGTMDLTIPADTLDTNDVLAFVKEISRFVFVSSSKSANLSTDSVAATATPTRWTSSCPWRPYSTFWLRIIYVSHCNQSCHTSTPAAGLTTTRFTTWARTTQTRLDTMMEKPRRCQSKNAAISLPWSICTS